MIRFWKSEHYYLDSTLSIILSLLLAVLFVIIICCLWFVFDSSPAFVFFFTIDVNTSSPRLTGGLCFVSVKHGLPVKCNSLIWDVMMMMISVKMWAQQSLISCCWVSLSPISSILFSCNRTLARSRLGSGIALGPSWVSLALIPVLCV